MNNQQAHLEQFVVVVNLFQLINPLGNQVILANVTMVNSWTKFTDGYALSISSAASSNESGQKV